MPLSKNEKIQLKSSQAMAETFKQLEAMANISSWEVDLITKESIWSDQSYKIYGLDKQTTKPSLDLFFEHMVKEDLQRAKDALVDVIASGNTDSFECSFVDGHGKIKNLMLNAKVIFDEDNTPIKLIGTTQDVTKLKQLEKKAKTLSTIMQNTQIGIYIIDSSSLKYLYVNDGACKSLGYTNEELLGMNAFDINPYLTKEHVLEFEKANPSDDHLSISRAIHKRKDGSEYHIQSYAHKINYQDASAYVVFGTDITIQKELEDRLEYQATHDALTNLPNRFLFDDRLTQLIKIAQRDSQKFALLFIDLDKFKIINDSLGHAIGDEVLKEVAYRLRKIIRGADTLARFGGDEFTIILGNLKESTIIPEICQKIISEIKKPIVIGEHTLHISSSIGISKHPRDSCVSEELIRYADVAMYNAKEDGRDTYKFFNQKMSQEANEKALLDSSLRIAIEKQQFKVHYQPQYNLSEDRITGMEALVRWEHPTRGLISPAHFIPIAEENGLIVEIDRIVMRIAMKQFHEWYQAGLNPGILALNLAMRQLNTDDFIELLTQTMLELDFQAHWLELEVTEGQVMKNPESAIKKLKILNALGIEIAIDDFGTGYSSLSYLKKLPLNKLKIDQSFVRDIATSEDDAAIIKAIIALAKSLNLNIIAEGVEEECQKQFLQTNHCDNFQGYLFAKPLPSQKIIKILQEQKDKNVTPAL